MDLEQRFESLGYEAAETVGAADLVVLNSCVVRRSAEDRVVNKLHALRPLKKARPDMLLALTGCLVDPDTVARFARAATQPGDAEVRGLQDLRHRGRPADHQR